MTVPEFLEWDRHQAWRHELVDGAPQAMTGARFEHDLIVVNLISTLSTRLRAAGSHCRIATAGHAGRRDRPAALGRLLPLAEIHQGANLNEKSGPRLVWPGAPT